MSVTNEAATTLRPNRRAKSRDHRRRQNLSTYLRHVYAFRNKPHCQFAGLATVGGNPSSVWINVNTNNWHPSAHEFGHTLGLYHSHGQLPYHHRYPALLHRRVRRYHRHHWAAAPGHYNAFQKQRIVWLDFNVSPPITTVQSSGNLHIDA